MRGNTSPSRANGSNGMAADGYPPSPVPGLVMSVAEAMLQLEDLG